MNAPIHQAPSEVTCSLVDQLIKRDAFGQRKYGTSLDRTDLTIDQWLQHGVEEALDMAGYMTAVMREVGKLRTQLEESQAAAREYALLRGGLERLLRAADRPRRYNAEAGFQDGFKSFEDNLREFLLSHDSAAVLRQLKRT